MWMLSTIDILYVVPSDRNDWSNVCSRKKQIPNRCEMFSTPSSRKTCMPSKTWKKRNEFITITVKRGKEEHKFELPTGLYNTPLLPEHRPQFYWCVTLDTLNDEVRKRLGSWDNFIVSFETNRVRKLTLSSSPIVTSCSRDV